MVQLALHAQFVKNVNAKIYKSTHPEVFRAIVENHCVDDYVDCFDTVRKAISVARGVVNIHNEAGLRGFRVEFGGVFSFGEFGRWRSRY